MLTEYDIVNAAEYTVPSTRVFAWYLGIDYRERPVAEITASVFTQSPQEFVVKHLAAEVHRASQRGWCRCRRERRHSRSRYPRWH